MAAIDYNAGEEQPQKSPAQAPPDMADLAGIARRGWYYMAAGTAVGLLAAFAVLSTMSPVYKANSRIAFERTLARYMQSNKVSNEPIIDDYDTMGQTYVISSESVLLKVIKSLSLANDPDFVGVMDNEGVGSRIRGLFRSTAQATGFVKEPAESVRDPEKIALEKMVRDLTVTREDVPSVMSIAFSSKDPVKAATIVNAIVDTYMEANIASKTASTKVASKVMQERVEELKQQAEDAERALYEFKNVNKLVGTDKDTLSHGQLNILGHSQTNARLALAEARSRMERLARDPDAIAMFTPDNDIISKLRQEHMDLSIRAKDIEKRVGTDHQAAVKIRTRMDEIREAIAEEQKRVSGSFKKDYELARARYDELSAAVSGVLDEEGEKNSKILSQLRGFEKAADALRGQYERSLQQVSELNRVDAQPSISPDARVLMRASPPTQTEASKKRWVIMGGGSFLGFLLGACFLLRRDFPFGVFRTSQQVTDVTGLPCAVLPEIEGAEERASVQSGEYPLNAPYSRFVETLRNVWALINVAQLKSDAKVVCVISSTPGEGKTTVATNLAAHFARNSTTRVLLVDADLHHASLTDRVAADAKVGLKEALAEPKDLSKFVMRKGRLNLDILPCPISNRVPNAAELLGTAEMGQLVDAARDAYDLVIIEVPPMAAVVDYKMIARHCDRFVFVVEWGKTSQRMVLECLNDASAFVDRIVCVVLNKVDPSSLRSIERYKGDRFQDYYSDEKRAS